MIKSLRVGLALSLAMLGGCTKPTSPPGRNHDAGPTDAGPDAGPRDSGPPDSGPPDAGPSDGGPSDSGSADSGPADSGPPDAGPPDSGPADAGLPDSGPADAGLPDAGPPDSGPPDAGEPDAGLRCKTHVDCPTPLVCLSGWCGSAGTVQEGAPCSASRDCQGGLYCAPQGYCLPAGTNGLDAGCTLDGQCQSGLRCDYRGFGGACAQGGSDDYLDSCINQSDCLPGLFCSPPVDGGSGQCVPSSQAFKSWPGVDCSDDGGLRVYFEVPRPGAYPRTFFRLPYPNDIRVSSGDGGEQLDLSDFPTPGFSVANADVVALYRDALSTSFAGFSPIAPVTFVFSRAIDLSTLNVQIVDLTASRPGLFYDSYAYTLNGTQYSCPNRLTVEPFEATPFHPGDTYAVILLTGIKDHADGGNLVLPDPDFAAMVGPSAPSDPNLTNAYAAYAPLRAWLGSSGNPLPSDLIAAAVFTVGDPTTRSRGVSSAVAQLPAPAVSDLGVCADAGSASSCDLLGADHACATPNGHFTEIHGRLALPIFQLGTVPYATPSAGGGIAFDSTGVAIQQSTQEVCFALTVPNGATPDGGWPLVIAGHGVGGSMTSFIAAGVAGALSSGSTPVALVGFDEVGHADRRGGSPISPEFLAPDELNPLAARDNYLQGEADLLSVAKLANTGLMVDGGPSVSFNSNQVVLFGHDLGARAGELALPAMNTASTAVVSGAESHVIESILDRTTPVSEKAALAILLQDQVSNLDDQHPVMGLLQTFLDSSDPLFTNPEVLTAPSDGGVIHSVLMTWGSGDSVTPTNSLNANATSLGIPVCGPELDGGSLPTVVRPVSGNFSYNGQTATGCVVQYSLDGGEGHDVAFTSAAAESDWMSFILSGLGATPTLP